MRQPIIQLRDAYKYWSAGENEICILQDVHLDIFTGESVAIMGPSGAGKSTLMHILAFLTSLDKGTIAFRGEQCGGKDKKMREKILKDISFIFQDAKLIPGLTVFENMAVPLIHRGIAKASRNRRIDEALELVSLGRRESHYPNQLSGGEMMRVAIARAIITRPKVIFADEPTGSLDSKMSKVMSNLLYSLVSPETALVVVTHQENISHQADRVLFMQDGKITSN